MKYQALFSLKNNEKIFKTSSSEVVIGALRITMRLRTFFYLKQSFALRKNSTIYVCIGLFLTKGVHAIPYR